jgi:hypothetical protein
VDFFKDRCRGGQPQSAATIFFRDKRSQKTGLGQGRDKFRRIGTFAIFFAPIAAGKISAQGTHGFAHLQNIIIVSQHSQVFRQSRSACQRR